MAPLYQWPRAAHLGALAEIGQNRLIASVNPVYKRAIS